MLGLNSLAFVRPKQEALNGCRTRDRTWAMGFKVPCATSTPSGNCNHPKRYSVRGQKMSACCVIKIRGSIVLCRSGGIGRRSGFKIRRGKLSCGFESHLRYQTLIAYGIVSYLDLLRVLRRRSDLNLENPFKQNQYPLVKNCSQQ